jgi:hypothetical protein
MIGIPRDFANKTLAKPSGYPEAKEHIRIESAPEPLHNSQQREEIRKAVCRSPNFRYDEDSWM